MFHNRIIIHAPGLPLVLLFVDSLLEHQKPDLIISDEHVELLGLQFVVCNLPLIVSVFRLEFGFLRLGDVKQLLLKVDELVLHLAEGFFHRTENTNLVGFILERYVRELVVTAVLDFLKRRSICLIRPYTLSS